MHRAASNFRRILILLLCLIFLGLGWLWFTAPADPVYRGKRLSEHLKICYGFGPISGQAYQEFRKSRDESLKALGELDDQAVPLLRAWLKRPLPSWRTNAVALAGKFGWQPRTWLFNHQLAACQAAEHSPHLGPLLLPELRACFSNPDPGVQFRALAAFRAILCSPEARQSLVHSRPLSIPDLMHAIEHGPPAESLYSLALFWAALKENALPHPEKHLPELVRIIRENSYAQRLIDPRWSHAPEIYAPGIRFYPGDGVHWPVPSRFDPRAYLYSSLIHMDPDWQYRHLLTLVVGPEADRVGAAWSLGNNAAEPAKAIPLLIANLSSTNRAVAENCAIALGKFGPAATPALPELATFLSHSNLVIRSAASNAIIQISGTTPAQQSW